MDNELIEVAVYMPDEEVAQFLLFKKHYDIFSVLIDKKIFDVRNGTVALNFDSHGTLQTIVRTDHLYSKKYEELGKFN